MEQTVKSKRGLWGNPQALAWIVLNISFVLFCVLCINGTYGAYWFFFQSPIALTTRLVVSKGTVTVDQADLSYSANGNSSQNSTKLNPDDDAQGYIISPNTRLTTDSNSQGYMSFEDTYTGQVVATVYILANSNILFTDASLPRFNWSTRPYSVLLSDPTGHFVVEVLHGVSRDSVLRLQSARSTAQVVAAGVYAIDAFTENMTLYTEQGLAYLYVRPEQAQKIEPGRQGTVTNTTDNAHAVNVALYPLRMLDLPEPGVPQPSFGTELTGGLPIGWLCTSPPPDDPAEIAGRASTKEVDQRIVLEMARINPTGAPLGHAETRCEFAFPPYGGVQNPVWNPAGLEVSQYSTLIVQIQMKIIRQDVTTCGVVGSECPVMLEIDYQDAQGGSQKWYQGFYAERPPTDSGLLRCDSCPHDHEQITRLAWYRYTTGDLRKQFPFNDPKVLIQKVRVYSSGHQYDVALADVSLLGQPATTSPDS